MLQSKQITSQVSHSMGACGVTNLNYMNHTERLLYGFEPNAKERLEDLARDLDHETFEVEPPNQHDIRYYDEQLTRNTSLEPQN